MKIPYKFNPFGVDLEQNKESMPTSGLIFYMPLSGSNILDEVISGRTMIAQGDITSANFSNINCANFGDNQGTCIYSDSEDLADLPTGDHSLSISIWVSQAYVNNYQTYFFYGMQNFKTCLWVFYNSSVIAMGSWGADLVTNYEPPASQWVHYVATYDKDTHKYYGYINGVLNSEMEVYDVDLNLVQIGIGCRDSNWDTLFTGGYMAGARIYDRALTSGEVATLFTEFNPLYEIPADDVQSIEFYPFNEYKSVGHGNTVFPITSYEIVSGSLPSNITFDTSNGDFYGHALTDQDHTYTIAVKMSGNGLIDKIVTINIITLVETPLSAPSPQSFAFITEDFAQVEISQMHYASDTLYVNVISGSLPTDTNIYSYGSEIILESFGTQTSNESEEVVISINSEYHQSPIEVTLNINIRLNQITAQNQEISFFTAEGPTSFDVKYTSEKTISPTFGLTGSLPSGITFNQNTGTFSYDGVGPVASGIVDVGIYSNSSVPASAVITLKIIEGDRTAPTDYSFYHPMDTLTDGRPPYTLPTGQRILSNGLLGGEISAVVYQNVQCIYKQSERNPSENWAYYTNGVAAGNDDRTVSFWMNCPNPGIGQVPFIYGYRDDHESPDYGSWFRVRSDNVLDLAYYDYDFRNHGANTSPNEWYNIVITVTKNSGDPLWSNSSDISYYINGINYGTWTTDIYTASGNFLNLFGDDWDNGYQGYMTDVRIYNRVLEPIEISALFKEHTFVKFEDQNYIFITSNGVETRNLEVKTNAKNYEYVLSGSLPTGITFNSASGIFTSDGTQQSTENGNVIVMVTPSGNPNTILASANIGLNIYNPTANPIITDGLTLFMPLSSTLSADVGIPLSSLTQSPPTLVTEDGIPCYYFNGSNVLGNIDNSYFTTMERGYSQGTLCFWFKLDIENCGYQHGDTMVAQIGSFDLDNGQGGWSFMGGQMDNEYRNYLWLSSYGRGWQDCYINYGEANGWHFYAVLFQKAWDDYTLGTPYIDDNNYGETQYVQNYLNTPMIALGNAVMNLNNGGTFRDEFSYVYGWYTGLRMYNRVLSVNELQQIAAEHQINQ